MLFKKETHLSSFGKQFSSEDDVLLHTVGQAKVYHLEMYQLAKEFW